MTRILLALIVVALGAGCSPAQTKSADVSASIRTSLDQAGLKALPPGSFYTEPPRRMHFAETRDQAVVLQITGFGPTGTLYADPAADPRKTTH